MKILVDNNKKNNLRLLKIEIKIDKFIYININNLCFVYFLSQSIFNYRLANTIYCVILLKNKCFDLAML